MEPTRIVRIECPYCGEPLEILVEPGLGRQEYVEDCQVCCKPMVLRVSVDAEGEPTLDARCEDD